MNEKWLLLASKVNKDKIKREVEKACSKLALQMKNPDLTQSGTLFRAQRNPVLFSYAASL